MSISEHITPFHLGRQALIYIRQSSPHQVLTNQDVGWKPLLPPLPPVEPAAKIPASIRSRPRVAKPERSESQPISTKRAFADPFAADDIGTNCIRCGYLISPAREKRGLMTCMQCR